MYTVAQSATETLDCPLCFKKFNSPRSLPCLHSFCEECLSSYIQSFAQDESEFMCPACKTTTTILDTKLPRDQWVKAFRLNSTIISILENETKTHDNDCEWCRRDHNKITAEFYCTGCREGLCADCRKNHQRIKLLMKHVIVSVSDVKDKSDFGRMINFDVACPHHQNKPLELYCTEHRKLCCVMC